MKKTKEKPKARIGRPPTGVTPQRIVRIATDEWEKIQKAAKKAGKTTSEWIRDQLAKAL